MNQNAATQPATVIIQATGGVPCFFGIQYNRVIPTCKFNAPVYSNLYDNLIVGLFAGRLNKNLYDVVIEVPSVSLLKYEYERKGKYSWGCHALTSSGGRYDSTGDVLSMRIIDMLKSYSTCNPQYYENNADYGNLARSAAWRCYNHSSMGQAFLPSPTDMRSVFDDPVLSKRIPKLEFWTSKEVNSTFAYTFDMNTGNVIMRRKDEEYPFICAIILPLSY